MVLYYGLVFYAVCVGNAVGRKSGWSAQIQYGRVAQLDRVSASEAEGRGFESHLAHQ